jgi:hypothetical protein
MRLATREGAMRVTFDSNIGRCLAKPHYAGEYVGIELEYEHASNYGAGESYIEGFPKGWRHTVDHSLRNSGIEYISEPTKRADLADSVNGIISHAREYEVIPTIRCGLHVHVNVTDLSWREMFQMVTYYAFLEPTLFAAFASGREMSHFCAPMWSNTQLAETLHLDSKNLRSGITVAGEYDQSRIKYYLTGGASKYSQLSMLSAPKYAALNVSSLLKFGTLEFRQAPSTLSASQIIAWAEILLNIRREALKYSDPVKICEVYHRDGIRKMLDAVGYNLLSCDHVDQEDADDTACFIAGAEAPKWEELDWHIQGDE